MTQAHQVPVLGCGACLTSFPCRFGERTLPGVVPAKPLCIVHGEPEHLFVSIIYARCATGRCGAACIQVIRGTGHAPHWQKADLFNRILWNYLQFAEFG
jgi:hypothetical protein